MSRVVHDGTPPAGALTTIFTATSAYCSTGSLRYSSSICMPTNYSAYWQGNVGYYSPAICPSGYSSAGVPKAGFGPVIEASETAIVCCPTGYTYSPSSNCYATATYTSTTTITRNSYSVTAGVTATVPVTTTFSTTASSWAYPVQVRWAETDLPNLETDPITGNKPRTTNATTSAGPAPTVDVSDAGLTVGQKAGIGVGAALGGLLLLVLLAFSITRVLQRKRANDTKSYPDQVHDSNFQGQESMYDPNKDPARSSFATSNPGHIAEHQQHHWTQPSMTTPIYHSQAQMDLNRIQERRSRLMELEHLEQEEFRIRSQMSLADTNSIVTAELPAHERQLSH